MLPFVIIAVGIMAVAIVLGSKYNITWLVLGVVSIGVLIGGLVYSTASEPPVTACPFEATVHFTGNGSDSTVYFSKYSQSDEVVLISDYESWSWHWFTLNCYDSHSDLRIKLQNGHAFVFTDRRSGIVSTSGIDATQ